MNEQKICWSLIHSANKFLHLINDKFTSFFFLHIVQHLYDMFPYKQMGNKSDTTLGQQHLNSTSEKHSLKCKHSR